MHLFLRPSAPRCVTVAAGLLGTLACSLDTLYLEACPADEIARGGACLRLCNLSADCDRGERCEQGVCQPCVTCPEAGCNCDPDRVREAVETAGGGRSGAVPLACAGAGHAAGCVDPSVLPPEEPPPEVCGNGSDDDADGQSDCDDSDCAAAPSCLPPETATCAIPNCNADLGEGAPGCWSDAGSCTALELDAWCTRRSDPGPSGLWYRIHSDWVDNQCSGSVSFDGNATYSCYDPPTYTTFTCVTPLLLLFAADVAVELLPFDGAADFDLAASGGPPATRTDWPAAVNPWLALDRDGDGAITSGEELFGSATPTRAGVAPNGFVALAELDRDGDGVVTSSDERFAELVVWADADGDRVSQPDELVSLAELGIDRLPLRYTRAPRCDGRGNCAVERAEITWRDARGERRRGALVDEHLRLDRPAAEGRRRATATCAPR